MRRVDINSLLTSAGLPRSSSSIHINGMEYDSRRIKAGDLFFAVPGAHVDGHSFLEEAQRKGAVVGIIEKPSQTTLPCVQVPSVLSAMTKLSTLFYDQPSSKIPVIGITGTNGKTTSTYLIEAILAHVGRTSGVMGTINYRVGADQVPAPNTTPMALDIHRFLADLVERNIKTAIMEVSSHALELNRVDDVHFAVGVFTNLTQDHLDFHKTMENYFSAKAKLFRLRPRIKSVINIDDPYGERLAQEIPGSIRFGMKDGATLRATNAETNLSGIHFSLSFPTGRIYSISNNLIGFHNISNCLAAAGSLLAYGLAEEDIVRGLNQKHAIPGRLERVEAGQDFVVVVDYAHTHDALAQVLSTLRGAGPRRLLCVFGAGGDRDKTKRPRMGKVAVEMADDVFITSDNPRSEDPQQIMLDIEAGIKTLRKKNYTLIEDREQAIVAALKQARNGDIVLIAGKGHETYQIYKNERIHFSDVEVAKKALQ